jgi:hypothetical protein
MMATTLLVLPVLMTKRRAWTINIMRQRKEQHRDKPKLRPAGGCKSKNSNWWHNKRQKECVALGDISDLDTIGPNPSVGKDGKSTEVET